MDKRRIAFIVLVATVLGLLPMATPASGFFGFRPSGAFHSVPATRIVDTGKNLVITGPLGQGAKATVKVAGAGGVPATGATAVMLRVTASGATKPTLVTTEGKAVVGWWLTPGAILPAVPRHTSTATLAVPLTSTGTITVANQFGKVGLTVDVLGWWGTATPPPPPPSTTTTTTSTTSTTTVAPPPPTTVPPPPTTEPPAPTTAPPPTTEPPADTTTTTTSTTSTTTTTTTLPPPPVEPPASSTWQYVPAAVLLNGLGDTATVDLRKVDVDGTDYDVDPPAGVTLQILGSTTAFDATDLGGGRLRLTATGQSGTTVRIATVPGQSTKAELTVTAAELQPGVVEIPDSQVLYPPPGVPAGFTPGATTLPGFTAAGPGPFTWEEFRARVASLPATAAPTSELVLGGDQRFPAVLRGPAPATGTLVIGNGASAIYGEVVEPSGLPTLERDGYSMVSLRLAALPDVFADLTYDIDLEEYFAATDPDAAAPVGAGRMGGAALELPARPTSAGAAGLVAGAPVAFVTADAPASSPCSTTLAVMGDSPPTITPTIEYPHFIGHATVESAVIDGRKQVSVVDIEFGLRASASFRLDGSLKGAQVGLECKIAEKTLAEKPLPGQFGFLLSVFAKAELKFATTFSVEGTSSIPFSAECSAGGEVRMGVRWQRSNDLVVPRASKDFQPPNCTSSVAGIQTGSVPVIVKFEAGPVLALSLGVRAGGLVAKATDEWLKSFFGEDTGFGEITLATLEIAAKRRVVWENRAAVLINGAAGSMNVFDGQVTAKVGFSPVAWVLGKLRLPTDLLDIKLVDVTIPGASKYRSPNPDELTVSVNGRPDDAAGLGTPVGVQPGDEVRVVATGKMLPEAFVIEGGDEVLPTRVEEWAKPSLIWLESSIWDEHLSVTGSAPRHLPKVVATTTITQSMCDEWAGRGREFSFVTIGSITPAPLPALDTPGIVAKVTLSCEDPKLEWQEPTIEIPFGQTVESNLLKGHALKGGEWRLDPMPAWLTASATSGNFSTQNTDDIDAIDFTVNCDASSTKGNVEAVVVARTVGARPTPAKTASLTVKADCREVFVKWIPPRIVGNWTAHLDTGGPTIASYAFDTTTIPTWLTVTPLDGLVVEGRTTDEAFTFTVKPRPAQCWHQASVTAKVKLVTSPVNGDPASRGRGSAIIEVVRPAVAAKPGCASKSAHSHGDPHLSTFDGASFDAQVVGEYVFVQPTDGTASTTVHARFGPWVGSQLSPAQPTVTKGVAVRMGTSTVEVLVGSPTVFLVNGVATTVPDDETLTIADGLFVARAGGRYLIETPDATVTVTTHEAYLDVVVSTETGVALAGLLGSPDDDLANDLRTQAGGVVTLAGAREHGPELYELTDSWRVTAVADSLFTEQDELFTRPNVPYNSAALEPFRTQARALLAALGTSCDTDSSASAYAVDALAIELSIGTPVDRLGSFTCSFTVQGTVTSGPDETPLEAVSVVLDGVGLGRCEATTTATGTYECVLPMDLAEITGAGLTTAPVITYQAAFAESPTEPIASGTVTTAGLPPLNGTAIVRNDVDVDVAFLPSLVVSGRFTGVGGEPYRGSAGMFMYLYGENGRSLGHLYTPVAIDSLDGTYEVLRALPRDVRTVDVEIVPGGAPGYDWREFRVENVVRERREVTYDMEVRPPSLAISGSLLVNGSAAFSTGSSYGLLIESTRADGSALPTLNQSVAFDRATGAVTGSVVLPDDAAEAVVVFRYQWGAFFGQHDEVRVPVTGLAPDERRDVVLAIDHQATTYDLTGAVSIDGVPSTGQVSIFANYYDAEGKPLGTQPSFNRSLVDGRYTVTGLRAPERAAMARVSIGQVGSGILSETRDLLLVTGDHTVLTFDLHQATTRFVVRGTTNCAGEPDLSSGGPRLFLYDGSTYLGQLNPVYAVDPDGRFETSVRLPVATDRVVLYVDRCVFTFLGDQQTSVVIVPNQENVYEVDMVTSLLRMSGAVTGTPEQLADINLWMAVEERDIDGQLIDEQRYGVSTSLDVDELDQIVGATYGRDVNLQPETDSVVVRFVDGRTDQVYSTVTYTGLGVGDHQFVHDVDLRPVTLLDWPISGVLMEGAEPLANVELTVTADAFILVPEAATYQSRSTTSRTVITDENGRWAVDADIAETADLGRVTVRLSNGQSWQRSFGVTPGDPTPYTFDIDHAARHLGYTGNVQLDGCAAPNTFEREVWTAASAPLEPYDWETGTWPGATLAGRFLVVPDLTAPYAHQITAEIPRDATWIGTVYRDRRSNGNGAIEVPANADIGMSADETASCDR